MCFVLSTCALFDLLTFSLFHSCVLSFHLFEGVICPFCLSVFLTPFLRCVLSFHLPFGCELSFQCSHCPFNFLKLFFVLSSCVPFHLFTFSLFLRCVLFFHLPFRCPFSVRIVFSPIFKVVSCPLYLCIVLSPFLRCVLSIHLFGCDLSFQCTHCPFTFLDVICPFFECIVLSLCGFTISGCVLPSNATSPPNAD